MNPLKKWYSNLTLQHALYTTFFLIFAPAIMILLLTTVLITGSITKDNYKGYTFRLLDSLENNISNTTNNIENLSYYLLSDNTIQKMLTSDPSSAEFEQYRSAAKDEINRLLITRNYIESISIYNFTGKGVSNGYAPSYITQFNTWVTQPWYSNVLSGKGKYVWTSSTFEGVTNSKKRVVFSRVVNRFSSQIPLGVMVITLNNDYLAEMVSSMESPQTGSFFVYDADHTLLFGNDNSYEIDSALSSNTAEDFFVQDHMYITTSYYSHTSWTFLCIIPSSAVLVTQKFNIIIIFLITILVFIIATVIYNKLSNALTHELNVLTSTMERSEDEDFKETVTLKHISEFKQLGNSYNNLINRINILVNENLKEKLNTKEAQLESLQAQINPHFLYNTLNSISWKALENNQYEISDMIQCLSRMFHYSIGRGEKYVSLEKEMNNLQDYLLLQHKRFGDKLVYLIDMNSDVVNYKIIKLLLQPLVENCIIHGIQAKEGVGYIGVTAQKINDNVIIQIWDNGIGINEEDINRILEGSLSTSPQKYHHIGIRNVQERLIMNYGPDSALQYQNNSQGGTKVTIRIPVDKLV